MSLSHTHTRVQNPAVVFQRRVELKATSHRGLFRLPKDPPPRTLRRSHQNDLLPGRKEGRHSHDALLWKSSRCCLGSKGRPISVEGQLIGGRRRRCLSFNSSFQAHYNPRIFSSLLRHPRAARWVKRSPQCWGCSPPERPKEKQQKGTGGGWGKGDVEMQGRRAGRDGGGAFLASSHHPFMTDSSRSLREVHCLGAKKPPSQKKAFVGRPFKLPSSWKAVPPQRQAGLFLGGECQEKRGGTAGSPLELRPFQVGGGSHHALREIKTKYNFLYSRVSRGGSSPPPPLRRRRDHSTKPGAPANSVPRPPPPPAGRVGGGAHSGPRPAS